MREPSRIAALPHDKHGRPVPWFVAWIDGKPDFRVIERDALRDAIRFEKCWVCGGHRGKTAAFVIGPMCAVNRVSAEPPSHLECAVFSAVTCPFLTTPNMVRREHNLPEDGMEPGGVMIKRNPGVTLVWSSRTFKAVRTSNGVLFDIGDPVTTDWYCQGRQATREEVLDSINSGLPALMDMATKDGPEAEEMLASMMEDAMELVPA